MDISNIWRFDLRAGNSKSPREGACLLDAVSWFEYGELGDHPPCVCPVIAAYGRPLNDMLPNSLRQRLKRFLPRLPGTVDKTNELARAEYAVRRTIRNILPLVVLDDSLKTLCEQLSENASMEECRRLSDAAAFAAYAVASASAAASSAYAVAAAAYASATAAAAAAACAAAASAAAAAAHAAHAASSAAHGAYEIPIDIFDGMLSIGTSSQEKEESWELAARSFELARHG